MTSDAIRQPGEPTRPAPEPTAPSATEETPPSTDEPTASGADEGTTTTGTESSEAHAEAQAATADAVAPAETATPAETVTTAEAVAATQAASAEAAAVSGSRRRERFAAFLRRFVTFALAVGLFVGGIALGSYIFQTTRPAPAVAPVGQVGTTTNQPPPVTQEFITALETSNFDALRSSLQKDPHLDLTDELQRFGIRQIDNVEVLGTHVSESRSATEILMQYENEEGIPFAINLVVLVDGGKIEGFR